MRNMNKLLYSRDNMQSLLRACGNGDNAALPCKSGSRAPVRQKRSRKHRIL